MTKLTTNEASRLSNDQIDAVLTQMADKFGQPQRAPVLHSPSELNLDYEDVTIPSLDGVPLEGWFIPAARSNKLVIANHPLGFSRSVIPTHFESWHSRWAPNGSCFDADHPVRTQVRDKTSAR